jgi:hypothetical protein
MRRRKFIALLGGVAAVTLSLRRCLLARLITEFGVPCVGIMQHTRETTPPAAIERNRTISGMLLLMVGQFRTADGLVLPSGRTLGPQMSCRSPTIQHRHLAHGVISDTKNRYRADFLDW